MEFLPWGSMPETDDQIAWAGTRVKHDAYELTRSQKVEVIVDSFTTLQEEASVRVCYSELNEGLNCSECEKCLRTIFNILLLGDNPVKYGFQADENVYDKFKAKIQKGFRTSGVLNYWKELHSIGMNSDAVFSFSESSEERQRFQNVLETIKESCDRGVVVPSSWEQLKFKIINKNKRLFEVYLKIRRKFS